MYSNCKEHPVSGRDTVTLPHWKQMFGRKKTKKCWHKYCEHLGYLGSFPWLQYQSFQFGSVKLIEKSSKVLLFQSVLANLWFQSLKLFLFGVLSPFTSSVRFLPRIGDEAFFFFSTESESRSRFQPWPSGSSKAIAPHSVGWRQPHIDIAVESVLRNKGLSFSWWAQLANWKRKSMELNEVIFCWPLATQTAAAHSKLSVS